MRVQALPPSGVVRPDYQSAETYRHDVWRGRLRVAGLVVAGGLLVAGALAARAGARAWLEHRERVRVAWAAHRAFLADEALCMSYAAPPGQPVYSEPQGEARAMLRQPDCMPLTWGQTVYQCIPSPAQRADDGPEITVAFRRVAATLRYPVLSGANAFVGGRRSPAGTERLVLVEARPNKRPASSLPRSIDFMAVSFTAAGPAPGQPPVAGSITFLFVPVPSATYVRVLAGQRDPSDRSRFTICYELNGVPATVTGRLNDDGTVSLSAMPDDG